MLKIVNLSGKVGTTPKLIQNFFPKKNYTVHYLTIQLYVPIGLKIEKVNQVLQFRQEKIIAPYVQLNNGLQKKMLQNLSRKKRFSSVKIIDQHLVSVTSKPVNIEWDKPTIVAAAILDLAKHISFLLQHNQKKNLTQFFYIRTLIRSCMKSAANISTIKLRKTTNCEFFLIFQFYQPPNLYTNENLRVTLKFQDESAVEIIQEYVILKPKRYSIISSSKFLFFRLQLSF